MSEQKTIFTVTWIYLPGHESGKHEQSVSLEYLLWVIDRNWDFYAILDINGICVKHVDLPPPGLPNLNLY